MFNFSGSEIIFLLLLALIILGPEKLPDAIRSVGRTYSEFKKMSAGFQSELKSALDEPVREMRETAEAFKKAASFDVAADMAADVFEGKPLSAAAPTSTPPAGEPTAAPSGAEPPRAAESPSATTEGAREHDLPVFDSVTMDRDHEYRSPETSTDATAEQAAHGVADVPAPPPTDDDPADGSGEVEPR